MACFVKSTVRLGVLAALAGGTAVLVAEGVRPGSVRAMLHQARANIGTAIDGQIEDPAALRAQIHALEAEYPARIAEVRADLAEVGEQIGQLERELAVADQVVDLTASDLDLLDEGVTRAAAAGEMHRGRVVQIAFKGRAIGVEDAVAKRNRARQTQEVYRVRGEEIRTELGFLADQRLQLAELLEKLESEQAEFQAQLYQLDAQIDSIARGERMIAMMEKRQATIDEHSRYQSSSLDQLQQRLARVRSEQQSRLASIANREQSIDYVERAQFMIDGGGGEVGALLIDPAGGGKLTPRVAEPDPILIDPAGEPSAAEEAPGDAVASKD